MTCHKLLIFSPKFVVATLRRLCSSAADKQGQRARPQDLLDRGGYRFGKCERALSAEHEDLLLQAMKDACTIVLNASFRLLLNHYAGDNNTLSQ
jgi:SpoVK/Ycf46/Vps4 family AAA+-type ATPase